MSAEQRILLLEKKIRILLGISVTFLILFISLTFYSFSDSSNRVIPLVVTRGIIIVDSLGKERILIGAPVPSSKHRVRTDLSRVKSVWGDVNFKGTKYMEYYNSYSHSANGLVLLDSNGFDRIVIGDPVPDPNIGNRVGPSTGIVINDQKGFERTGYGILKMSGGNRIVLGLDGNNGSEAAALGVYENGEAGLSFYGAEDRHSIFIGRSPKNSQLKEKLNGLVFWNDTIPQRIMNSFREK